MDEFRFRPHVTPLEDRLTPATPADVLRAFQTVAFTADVIPGLMARMNEPWGVYDEGYYQTLFPALARQNRDAGAVLGEVRAALQEQVVANPASAGAVAPVFAQVQAGEQKAAAQSLFADMVGVAAGAPIPAAWLPPAPPAPPPPPPAPGPVPQDDSGMVDTIPPLDAPEWVAKANGIRTWDVVEGTGDAVQPGETVTVHYTGWLVDGTQFDSSRPRGEPSTFSLLGVIRGWQQEIPGMKPGGIRRLDIPPEQAYGAAGNPPSIPPNARLVFEVKLLGIGDDEASEG